MAVGLPRTRGDGPFTIASPGTSLAASPHTRGWTRRPARRAGHADGFPAHAGMDRSWSRCSASPIGLPRTRGDGPSMLTVHVLPITASPHTRGWTRDGRARNGAVRGFPAHAGMDPAPPRKERRRTGLPRTRGDGPTSGSPLTTPPEASPHTRGWTRRVEQDAPRVDGFPAHAGMDPRVSGRETTSGRLPRTRGDGPRDAAPHV